MPVTQDNRHVSVTTALGADVLLFHRLTGSDQLGRLSEYRVQMLSTNASLKIADVLGKPIGIHVDLPGDSVRHFHGIVTRFSSVGWQDDFSLYEATVHPALWLLTRSANCRIFQDMSIVDIVKEVCGDSVYGGLIDLSVTGLSGTYSALPYCVQYRETDFNFVCRLLENEGIYFYFTHEETKHTMVLADSYGAHSKIPGYASVPFTGERGRKLRDGESVFSWSAAGQIQSSSYVMNDFDFEKATASTSNGLLTQVTLAAAFSQPAYERFDYPGGYTVADTGTALARGRMEALHGQCEQIDAETSARGLFPGGLFSLEHHPREDQNREFLVTAAQYDIRGNAYRADSDEPAPTFQCRFSAVGKEHSFRPQPLMVKPLVQGPQTAMVVGKAGEEIWTDKYGRVKVQFHWDRLGKEDEKSSCWVRVSQGWAGKGWGAMFIPRIGMEVVVSFLEGDPDRPLVTGCVYNGDAMPPYGLPAEQTKSTIMSNSSKGGAGYNEIRFEDKKDSEELYVQAEKDYNRVVKNNDTLKVGFEKKDKGDQTIAICNDQSLDVGNDRKVHVKHDQTTAIDNDQSIDIGNNRKLHVKNDQTDNIDNNLTVTIKAEESRTVNKDQSVKVDGNQKITVGKTCVVEATSSIELIVGGSSIKIEPAKITIKSAQIAIEGSGPVSVKSSAILTIEGSLVKIN